MYLEIYTDNNNALLTITGYQRSRDLKGTTIGMPLTTALRSNYAVCEVGLDTVCQSSFGNLYYVIDDAECGQDDRIITETSNSEYRIATCITVAGLRLIKKYNSGLRSDPAPQDPYKEGIRDYYSGLCYRARPYDEGPLDKAALWERGFRHAQKRDRNRVRPLPLPPRALVPRHRGFDRLGGHFQDG